MRRAPWALCIGLALAAPSAFAQQQGTPDLATRRVLIEQAQQASRGGDHALALQRAEQAMAIQISPSLRLFYASELVQASRPADAFAQAEACVREAERDSTVPNREAVLSGCRGISQSTRGEIGMLTVTVSGERPPGMRITVGGRPLVEALLGVPSAVNPGAVVVEASAEGFRTVRREASVERGATAQIELTMERDPHVPVGRGAQGLEGQPPREEYRTRPISIGAVVVTAAGGALLASSGIFYALRQGAIASCPINAMGLFECADADAAQRLRDNAGTAETMNTMTNVALIGGSVVLAGGVAWLVADRMTSRERVPASAGAAAQRVRPTLTAFATHHGAAVVLGGAW